MMTIDTLFMNAVEKNASDIHFIVGKPPILRIDGRLSEMNGQEVMDRKIVETLVMSMVSEKQKEIFLNDKELDLSYEVKGKSRFRVNLHFEKNNMGLVARVIKNEIPTMQELAMPEVVYELINADSGLVLITGPTGCGKSTSLAAIIDQINNDRSAHIVTLEDPIEFIFEPRKSIIKQRQLHTDMVNFHSALVHVLRQDPNVIMVGEMRDLETIATTITLAETGHLVLATLHTHNAAQTIDRIIDIFPPHQQQQIRLQVSMTLKGIISQRLIPKVGGGRVSAREVLVNTPAVGNLIRENKIAQLKTVIQTSAEIGMFTMDQNLIDLANKNVITKDEAQFHMLNPELLD